MGRDPEFGPLQGSEKDTRLLLDRFCDDMAVRHLHGQRLLNERRRDGQQLFRSDQEVVLRHGAMALLREGLQHMPDTGLRAVQPFGREPQALG